MRISASETVTSLTIVWYEGGANLNDKRWLLTDSRGSVVALTDDDGDADLDDAGPMGPAINAYDEFGAPAAGNVGRFQFTGQMWLPEIGLYYYKARLYHSGLGRFMQTDPIGTADGLNMYAYVGNDPVNRADPSGLAVADEVYAYGIRPDYNRWLEFYNRQLLRDIAFASFPSGVGEGGVIDQEEEIYKKIKEDIDKSLCGQAGTAFSDSQSAARQILPNASETEIKSLAYYLDLAAAISAQTLRENNSGNPIYYHYVGYDTGAYIFRANGGFTARNGNVAAPEGRCFQSANQFPCPGIVVTVVTPYVNVGSSRRDLTKQDYAARIRQREERYRGTAGTTRAPVFVDTPYGKCLFK